MPMYAVREKASGEITRLFYNLFEAREFIKNKDTHEVVERYVENDYKMFPDGRSYIVGTHSVWIPVEIRS